MPYYETVFIARQDMTESQVKELTSSVEAIITDNGGKVHKVEQWGLRSFAYPINKAKKGHYVLVETDAPAEAVHEMERQLGLNEDVVRSLTTREDALSDGPSIILAKSKHDEKEAA